MPSSLHRVILLEEAVILMIQQHPQNVIWYINVVTSWLKFCELEVIF